MSPDALPRIDIVTLPADGLTLDQFTNDKQVPRMREMLPGPQTKLDRTAKLGKNQVPAHKLIGLMEIPMDPPEWLQIWTVWTILFDRVFSITFTVRRADVSKYPVIRWVQSPPPTLSHLNLISVLYFYVERLCRSHQS